MRMPLPVAQDIQSARAAAATMDLAAEEKHFFVTCALEVIAQGILTLSIRRGMAWTTSDLIEQIHKPRDEFEPSGLTDGVAETILFDVPERQRHGVIATAVSMIYRNFGDEPAVAA